MNSSVVRAEKKKFSGALKGYLILFSLVAISWVIFKLLTPHNFGTLENMQSYFQASLIATVGAVGFYFVMVMGMFDFSIGANIMLSAIVGCVFATKFRLPWAYRGKYIDRSYSRTFKRSFLCKAKNSVNDSYYRTGSNL